MDIHVEEAGPCRKVLRIRAGANEVMGDYEAVLDRYAGTARIPGFRQGKAPRTVVEKRYADSIVSDLKEALIPRLYRQAVESEKLATVAIVEVQDVTFEKAQGAACRITVDVAPEFNLPDYQGIPVTDKSVPVSDEDVESGVQSLRGRLGRFEDIKGRPVNEGDLVRIDFRGTHAGQPLSALTKEASGLDEAKDFLAIAGEPEFLPGFGKGLIGLSEGDKKDLELTFPADYRIKELAGRAAVFALEVKGIRERVPAEMNEEFFKRIGVADEAELRSRIRADMEAERQQAEARRQNGEIIRYLLDRTAFDLPQSIVEDERRRLIRNIARQIMDNGGTREQLEEQQQSIMDAASKSSADRVKIGYILSRIAMKESVTVEDDEVNARVRQMAAGYQMTEEQLREELIQRNAVEGLRSDIRSEKTLELLLKKAKKQQA